MTSGRRAATERLYLGDDHCFETDATVVAVDQASVAFDRTCFYPGGGGQPPDRGSVTIGDGAVLDIVSARADSDEIIWHLTESALAPELLGHAARLLLDRPRRQALTRYHTVLHVLNTIVLRDYGGWITGAQIAVDYSRIDFKLEGFSAALCAELDAKVNGVLGANRALASYTIPEAEFRQRPELLRTLDAQPPVWRGQVRVVEIEGFDAQACGGTHVRTTGEVGRFAIVRAENQGRNNKRLYVRLDDPAGPSEALG
jgi:misacylated tRNA(Ala) deacylase